MDSLEQDKYSTNEQQTASTEIITEFIVSEPTVTETEENEQTSWNTLSKAELIEKLREVVQRNDDGNQKAEVDLIKQLFYKKQKFEKDAQEGEENNTEDAEETTLKTLLNDFKEKRAKIVAQTEALKEKNLGQRQVIVDKIKLLLDSPETIHEHVTEFKQLQQEWKEIGHIPMANANHLFKSYNLYVENFYDLLKINNELRDYDFKKNLELKTVLCVAAEKLDEETDVISAFHSLQKLHEDWAQTGPVAKDLREPIWQRFKAASTLINKKHQGYFESLKQQEEENLNHKTQICDTIEKIDYESLKTFKEWDSKTEEVIKLQQEWKTIGFTSRKMNVPIYERYRTACDTFFTRKSEFFKEIKEELTVNLEKKKGLIAKAESLKDSTDWKETTQKLIDLQKEWKTIGSIPRKQSDAIWSQFIAACDCFFEQKEKAFSSLKSEEKENLDKKIAIIEKIETFQRVEDLSDSVANLKEIISEFNAVGHVPFKDKDKIYKRFRSACDTQFDALNVDAANRHIDAFAVSLESMAGKDKNKLFREREKLLKQFDRLKSEINTCENNIGFFSSNSKKPNPMIVEMQRNIEKLKGEKDLLLKKIQLIEAQLA
ncbi:MAG: DUF349 domain-containing protein [Paludibacteraceae bacterium]|nr:DUF349 domain-containing protein [Paludibacteraceae bacterium]